MRGIYITLRAANYTGQAMSDATKGLNKVQQAQVRLAKSSLQLGLIYVAMGAMAIKGLIGIMEFSDRGKQVMEDFTESIAPSLEKLGDALGEVVSWVAPMITSLMGIATANPIITKLALGIGLVVIGGMIAIGVIKIFAGALVFAGLAGMNTSGQLLILGGTVKQWIAVSSIGTISATAFAAALMKVAIAAGAGFAIFLVLEPLLGALPAVLFGVAAALAVLAIQLWSSAHAMSILSFGVAAIIGTAAIGVALATASSAPTYHSGTTMVRKTGLGMLKAGEVVYDPTTQQPREIFNDMNRGAGGANSENLTVIIENLYTKSDKDELDERFARIGRMRMRRNR